jgi:hypothetical protein
LRRETLPSSKDGCSAGFSHLFPEVMQFGLRYSTSNVYYEGEYGASEV